jgi:HPt (histidine-containing phosphotransfer) domain-containing protein
MAGSGTAADLQASLRETFGADVAARLPRLQDLLDGHPDDLDAVRRDAHTLASSAVIVGEPVIAELAHQVELHLADGPLAELLTALRGFTP